MSDATHPPAQAPQAACALCVAEPPGALWRDDVLSVIRVDDTPLPGFIRIVWRAHIAEMTDLDAASRSRLMCAVWLVEDALRGCLHPDKINLASLGNQVPHLHWHIIPRWRADPYFPGTPWSTPLTDPAQLAAWEVRRAGIQARLPAFHQALIASLKAGSA
ncbi:HIT family protein [Castellaniella sp. GW247-6E4]|uniref:HIT family protein n=1 Tax=Castellaniella sp. GW247-6E4 TaxID=3140380 RepID=UPI00331564B3